MRGCAISSIFPGYLSAFRQAVEASGGHLTDIYLTMGQYDLIAIIEAPDDQTCVSTALGLCSLGNLRSTTLKAFGEDELDSVVENIPSLEEAFTKILSEFQPPQIG